MFHVIARLGPKVLLPNVPKQSDYDLWRECRNCGGTLYPKHETKVEPELEPIKEPSDGKQAEPGSREKEEDKRERLQSQTKR